MKVKMEVTKTKEFDLSVIEYRCHVRYWDDASFNGVEDCEEGLLNPFKEDDEFVIQIDAETGVIRNWTKGLTAKIHYKTCDRNSFSFHAGSDCEFLTIEDQYVPDFMPNEHYGDYVILNIDQDGSISNWDKDKVIMFFNEYEVEDS